MPGVDMPEAETTMCAFILPGQPTHLPLAMGSAEASGSADGDSFMVTNRAHPGWTFPVGERLAIRPLPDGGLSWCMSTVETNDPNADNYRPVDRRAFAERVRDRLERQAEPQVTVFVHGLDSLWRNAVHDTGILGRRLHRFARYEGLVIGFDWPSYGEVDSALHYATSDPPSGSSGSIRDNINGSVAAFGHLLRLLADVRGQIAERREGRPWLGINLVCHSEGNYMAMLGLAGASGMGLDQVVLLAADIDNGAFQMPDGRHAGRAADVARSAERVTVYYSNNDDTLVGSQAAFQRHHNPAYGGRLGHTGPAYNHGPQQPNMCSVDCSSVVSDANPEVWTCFPEGVKPSLHCSYLVLPQLVRDIAATLTGTPAFEVANRRPTRNPNDFVMHRAEAAPPAA